jgi:ribosome-associated protein
MVKRELPMPADELRFTFSRSSGPGGQNVQKVNSKATLRWHVSSSSRVPEEIRRRLAAQQGRRITAAGELVISSQRYRDAGRNVADCLDKLRQMLDRASIVPRQRRPTRPTRGSIRRRLQQKEHRSQKKRQRGPPKDGE